jgi:hypothetical protein
MQRSDWLVAIAYLMGGPLLQLGLSPTIRSYSRMWTSLKRTDLLRVLGLFSKRGCVAISCDGWRTTLSDNTLDEGTACDSFSDRFLRPIHRWYSEMIELTSVTDDVSVRASSCIQIEWLFFSTSNPFILSSSLAEDLKRRKITMMGLIMPYETLEESFWYQVGVRIAMREEAGCKNRLRWKSSRRVAEVSTWRSYSLQLRGGGRRRSRTDYRSHSSRRNISVAKRLNP